MQVGDTVITMGAPGRFKVVAVDGSYITIESPLGIRKTVLIVNLRTIDTPAESTEPA